MLRYSTSETLPSSPTTGTRLPDLEARLTASTQVAPCGLIHALDGGHPLPPAQSIAIDPNGSCVVLYRGLQTIYSAQLASRWVSAVQLYHGTPATTPAGQPRTGESRVALANGTALSAAELFSQMTARAVVKQLRAQGEHEAFARFMQFRGQAWSVLEYLAGAEAPPDRLGRFQFIPVRIEGGRLSGSGVRAPLRSWIRCFARSLANLGFAAERGHRTDCAAGDPCRDPRATAPRDPADRAKRFRDRIQAMPDAGRARDTSWAWPTRHSSRGAAWERDERFTPTAIWALESISSLAWGSDAARWETWWAGRNPDAARGCEFAEQSVAAKPVGDAASPVQS